MPRIAFSYILLSLLTVWLFSCQTAAPAGSAPAESAATTTEDSTEAPIPRLSPKRVDIRGYITQREYNQGQVVIFVEGTLDQDSQFSRALVLVTPITQVIGPDGKSRTLSELAIGQYVSILFRGRFRQGAGFSAQATARKLWIEASENE
ncbi:hypothetical protein [Rufibacter radiotolerans]|uniref:hypothetical protein n=1 Tax=Rufibacter radiotolerans TaxID=1379910 RepID=UPI0018CDDC5D|nr:hypothetical protein [Rufibacter radiotolerans]